MIKLTSVGVEHCKTLVSQKKRKTDVCTSCHYATLLPFPYPLSLEKIQEFLPVEFTCLFVFSWKKIKLAYKK